MEIRCSLSDAISALDDLTQDFRRNSCIFSVCLSSDLLAFLQTLLFTYVVSFAGLVDQIDSQLDAFSPDWDIVQSSGKKALFFKHMFSASVIQGSPNSAVTSKMWKFFARRGALLPCPVPELPDQIFLRCISSATLQREYDLCLFFTKKTKSIVQSPNPEVESCQILLNAMQATVAFHLFPDLSTEEVLLFQLHPTDIPSTCNPGFTVITEKQVMGYLRKCVGWAGRCNFAALVFKILTSSAPAGSSVSGPFLEILLFGVWKLAHQQNVCLNQASMHRLFISPAKFIRLPQPPSSFGPSISELDDSEKYCSRQEVIDHERSIPESKSRFCWSNDWYASLVMEAKWNLILSKHSNVDWQKFLCRKGSFFKLMMMTIGGNLEKRKESFLPPNPNCVTTTLPSTLHTLTKG
eukprot:Sdes_comp19412_c0_seq1m10742